jgi:hypothetical protein
LKFRDLIILVGEELSLKQMITVCGFDCHECGAFLAIKERDGNLVSDRYFWIREPKTP